MFAQAEKFDVLDDDHFVVANTEGRAVQNVVEILVIAAREKFERFFKALRSFAQTFAIWIFADELDDFAHVARDRFRVERLCFFVEQDFFRWFRSHVCVPCLFPSVLKAVVCSLFNAHSFQFCMRERFQSLENFDA